MFDVKLITENRGKVLKSLEARNFKDLSVIDEIDKLNLLRKDLVGKFEQVKTLQNSRSKEMPVVMKTGTVQEKTALKNELKLLSEQVKSFAPQIKEVEEKLKDLLLSIPNILSDKTPLGKDENDNVAVRTFGEKPSFDFQPAEHFDIAEKGLDLERGVKLSGARFVVYSGDIATLERALVNYMMDKAVENGYTEIVPPVLVNRETMTGSGQLPKFEDDAYKTTEDMFLIPTAEVSLVNLHRDEIVPVSSFPINYAAYTPCFRREAGSYGKDIKGIIRLHQFNKVELVKFTLPEESEKELEILTQNAESVLQGLGLHYKVIELCSGDVGFNAMKTYDIEVWLPGQNCYREISSCSNTGDFQARRSSIRFKREESKKPEFAHILNGSGLAIDRCIVAILENYQQPDGSVKIPEVLRSYMGNKEVICF
jgi:seryl-tRNA synthetase